MSHLKKLSGLLLPLVLLISHTGQTQTITIMPGGEDENFFSKSLSFQPSSVSVEYTGEGEDFLSIKSLIFLSFIKTGSTWLSGARFWLVAANNAPLGTYNGGFEIIFRASTKRDTLSRSITIVVSTTTSVEQVQKLIPTKFTLEQNYPNPFNPTTTIQYKIPTKSTTKLVVYNLLGEKVATLVDEEQQAGVYSVIWNGKDDSGNNVASGIYLYRLEAGDPSIGSGPRFVQVKKLALVR